ncbi:hypothetical protein [Marinospirillum perlucidum]|uniref:hypothetical protein n=1 Tax=Marinospirillum perlucidum TaxID=1982602 RepID=UPI000DF47D01|nr:hypothetical protein [Marinospirillum perlucidum]
MALPPLALVQITSKGPSLEKDPLEEISLLLVDNGQAGEHWYQPVTELLETSTRPQLKAGYREELQQEINQRLQGRLLLGYPLREHLAFLKAAGLSLPPSPKLCLQKLASQIEPGIQGSPGLLQLAEALQLLVLRPWRAADRVLLLWQLYNRWQADLQENLDTWLGQQRQTGLLPAHLDQQLWQQLPDTPGVYLFYAEPPSDDQPATPLYIGKSIHLRSRVKSHFSADQRSSKAQRLIKASRHLDWITTAGDLGAQLLEAQLVKHHQPLFNRRLRYHKKLLTWWQPQTLAPLRLISLQEFMQESQGQAYGLFNQRRQAQQQLRERLQEAGLCPAITGLEQLSQGQACFAHQLGHCRGACCGQESLETHQQRLQSTLAQWQFEHWPWPDGLILQEEGAGGCDYLALNAWQFLGRADSPEAAQQLLQKPPEHFDKDAYRLLRKALQPALEHQQQSWEAGGSFFRVCGEVIKSCPDASSQPD